MTPPHEAAAPTNGAIAALLREYADLLELRGESPFRTRAYRHAADQLATLPQPASTLSGSELQEIEGIGPGLASAIVEISQRGTFSTLEEVRAEIPSTVIRFTTIPGIGVKTAARLYRILGVATLAELTAAAREGRVAAAAGLGAKVERTVLSGLEQLAVHAGRVPLGVALPLGQLVAAMLGDRTGTAIVLAGSTRRRTETVGDLNFVAAGNPEAVIAAFASLPPVVRVTDRTATTMTVELDRELAATLTVAATERFGTEVVRQTGSPAHLAELQGSGEDIVTGAYASEEALYAALGLPIIPPELREGHGEVAAARAGQLPDLIGEADLRGDLHAHSTWSDGASEIEAMAQAAIARGYAYLSVSDHTQSLGIANGLDERRVREQWREIDQLNAALAPFRLLKSAEVEIKRDGTLDLPDALLAELDIVVASLHSGLRDDREKVTARLVRAMQNPHVDIIAHPSGRIVGGRGGADYDWEAIYRTAVATGTVLEINASPERLDLRDEHARAALGHGVRLAIGSDAHHTGGLVAIGYGVAVARRAWATAGDILNTLPLDELLASVALRG